MSTKAAEFDITPERAIALLRGAAAPLPTQTIPVAEAAGRILAAALISAVDRPAADDSALDGYACLEADTELADEGRPVRLELVGSAAAGSPFAGTLAGGQAVRVATGALVPHVAPGSGTVGVVGVEHAHEENSEVVLTRPATSAAVRPRGQDLRRGATYLRPGHHLDSAAIGLAAAMGHGSLEVRRRPRLLIIGTGNELYSPGESVPEGGIYESNGVSLAAAARRAGAEVIDVLRVSDDLEELTAVLKAHSRTAAPPDLIVTSGGVSRGRRDMVRDLMLANDRLTFWRVTIRPAGPTMFGAFDGVPLLGLPGNPVSSLVGFLLFGRAYLDTALGRASPLPYFDRFAVRLVGRFEPQVKTVLHRARLETIDGVLHAREFDNQSSGVLRSLVEADVLVVTPPRGAAAAPSSPDAADSPAQTAASPRTGFAIAMRHYL